MRTTSLLMAGAVALALSGAGTQSVAQQAKGQSKGQGAAQPQAKGQAKGGAQAQQKGQAKGRSDAAPAGARQPAAPPGPARAEAARAGAAGAPGTARGRFMREVALSDVPAAARQLATSNRRPQVIAAGAFARAHARGVDNELRIVPASDRVTLTNQRGRVLVVLDETQARDLGAWDVNVFNAPATAGAPSFCRSGAGHPVWGRQWCLDKGFGLGVYQDVRWGRTTSIGDIIFGRTVQPGRLTTDALLSTIGATAFNRLALHAITLGYTEPLVGTWVADPREPPVLLVNAGPAPVAELVDVNRDGRADLMLVALRPW